MSLPKPDEKCIGDWIATPKYEFKLSTHDLYDEQTIRMECYGLLIVDFDGGGEQEYLCRIIYNVTDFNQGQLVDELSDIVYENLTLDFEELFISYNIFNLPSPDFDLWKKPSYEWLHDSLSKAIDDFYRKYWGQ